VKVQINASKMQPLPAGETGMYGKTEELREYIPDTYNANTTLTENITGPTTIDFPLSSPPRY
jgi:hypothetical protein